MDGPARPADGAGSATAWASDQVLGMISRGALRPGQRLPPERDLALQLGVSRSSIREATSALVMAGILDSRRGAGVYVTSLDPDLLLSSLRRVLEVARPDTHDELLSVRALLEPAAAAAAAGHRTPKQLGDLDALVERLKAATSLEEAASLDRSFHHAVALGSGNVSLAALVDALHAERPARTIWRSAWDDVRVRVGREHLAVLDAIHAGDGDAAREAAALHLMHDLAELRVQAARTPAPPTAHVPSAPAIDAAAGRETPSWFRDAKLGVIVHWGIYSVPGWAPLDDSLVELLTDDESTPRDEDLTDPLVSHPFAEWYQNSAAIEGSPTWQHHRATYGDRPYADFRGEFLRAVSAWDAESWADLFAAAGVRYVIPVAKHHDGFLLWPSSTQNPHRSSWFSARDVVGGIARAVRARGMRLGVYYSGGVDWTFDHLPIRRMADVPHSVPRSAEYARYADAHWRDLIERYEPSILWNDINYPAEARPLELFRDYYARVPDGLVTDRWRAGTFDVATPNYARRHTIDPRPWEGVRAMGLSFGWNRQETADLTLTGTELVHLLVDVVSKNGNLLLGVSPDAHGRIPAVQERGLRALGAWLERNGDAVYGTRPWVTASATTDRGTPVRFTTRGPELFVSILGATSGVVVVPGLFIPDGAVVRRLDDGRILQTEAGRDGTRFTIPRGADDHAVVLRVSASPDGLLDL